MLKLFTCQHCGGFDRISGGGSSHTCDFCKVGLGLPVGRTPQREAHKQVADAIRAGVLPKPSTLACADCAGAAIEYDHRDYSKPLHVAAVCRRCNLRRGPAMGSPTLTTQAA